MPHYCFNSSFFSRFSHYILQILLNAQWYEFFVLYFVVFFWSGHCFKPVFDFTVKQRHQFCWWWVLFILCFSVWYTLLWDLILMNYSTFLCLMVFCSQQGFFTGFYILNQLLQSQFFSWCLVFCSLISMIYLGLVSFYYIKYAFSVGCFIFLLLFPFRTMLAPTPPVTDVYTKFLYWCCCRLTLQWIIFCYLL